MAEELYVVKYELLIYDGITGKPKINIPGVTKVKVTRQLKKPAEIEILLPSYANLDRSHIQVGDKIIWKRGYNEQLRTVFIGYVKFVSDRQPFIIRGYDKLYFIFKQFNQIKFAENIKESEYLAKLIPNTEIIWRSQDKDLEIPYIHTYLITRSMIDSIITRFGYVLRTYYMDFIDETEYFVIIDDIDTVSEAKTYNDDIILLKSPNLVENVPENIQVVIYLWAVTGAFDVPLEGRKQYASSVTKYPKEEAFYGKTEEDIIFLKRDLPDRVIELFVNNNSAEADYFKETQGRRAKEIYEKETLLSKFAGGDCVFFGRPEISLGERLNIHLNRTEKQYNDLWVEKIEDVVFKGIKQKVFFREEF